MLRLLGLVSIGFLLVPSSLFALTIAGTGDSEILLRNLSADFMQRNPGVQVNVPPSVGSSGGIRMLLKERTDLARIARSLKNSERAKGLHYRAYAQVPVVFVAKLDSDCVSNLDAKQVVEIFRGQIKRWSELGECPNHKIYLARREDGDSSNKVLNDKIAGLDKLLSPQGRVLYTTPEALETIMKTPDTLGYLPLSQAKTSDLKIFSYNGIPPEAKMLESGQYPLQLPLGIAWRAPLNQEAERFLEYLTTSPAKEIIAVHGAVPVTARGTAN